MKKFILVLIAALSMKAQAIQFDNPQTQQLTMTLTEYRTGVFLGEGHRALDMGSDLYSIVTFNGFNMPSIPATPEEISKLRQYARAVTKICPLTITFDRNTGVISKAKLACDPLAQLDIQDNEG